MIHVSVILTCVGLAGAIAKCGRTPHMHIASTFKTRLISMKKKNNTIITPHTCSVFGENLDEINCWCTQKSHSSECIALK